VIKCEVEYGVRDGGLRRKSGMKDEWSEEAIGGYVVMMMWMELIFKDLDDWKQDALR
jgi:hypothetical protein